MTDQQNVISNIFLWHKCATRHLLLMFIDQYTNQSNHFWVYDMHDSKTKLFTHLNNLCSANIWVIKFWRLHFVKIRHDTFDEVSVKNINFRIMNFLTRVSWSKNKTYLICVCSFFLIFDGDNFGCLIQMIFIILLIFSKYSLQTKECWWATLSLNTIKLYRFNRWLLTEEKLTNYFYSENSTKLSENI